MKIDLHCHYYPSRFIEELKRSSGRTRIETDSSGELMIVSRGGRSGPITEEMHNLELRLDELERCGMDMQVLSMPHPGVDFLEGPMAADCAAMINEEIAWAAKKYPGKFMGFATLSFQEIDRAIGELRRSVKELGLKGFCLLSNLGGRPVDSPELEPLYANAEGLGAVVFLHPTTPAGIDAMREYRLAAVVGFEFELTLALTRLIYSGFFERHPRLRFLSSHLGGALPFLAERIERGYYDPQCRVAAKNPPSHYYRAIYCDTVVFKPEPILYALQFYGAEKITLGSDYPFRMGNLPESIKSISRLDIPEAEKELIFCGNARRLLGI